MVIKMKTINQIADDVIDKIMGNRDPFLTTTLVFHNMKVAQWFKAYYLKKHDEVLMNVNFTTLGVFMNDILNPEGLYHIMSSDEFRNYVIKALLCHLSYDSAHPSNPLNYIVNPNNTPKGSHLYELADRLTELFVNYEYDEDSFTGWEKELYDEAVSYAESDDCYTAGSLFRKVTGTTNFIEAGKNFTAPAYIIDNAYISNLYLTILNEFNSPSIIVYSLEPIEDNLCCDEIFTAPSILREVEVLHTKINQKILADNTLRFNDFQVYAPNINDYADAIHQVFKQDDVSFPAIPYRIVGEQKDQRHMQNALTVLLDMANKRYFTRRDLYQLISNPMVRAVRDFSDEEAKIWMDCIDETNTFRNREAEDDWDYFKKRILISKLAGEDSSPDNKTVINDKSYLPYQTINMDFESANKLIDLIDAMGDWCRYFKDDLNAVILSSTDLENLTKLLDGLFAKKKKDGEEGNYLYRKVLEQHEQLITLKIQIPANTWLRLLLDAPTRFVENPADMFFSGVTFMSLNADDIVANAVVFVLGLSSNQFPRIYQKSELDLSACHRTNEELDAISIHNILSGSKYVFCSYICRNLKNDVEYYPSSLMPKTRNGSAPERATIDESRDYGELFTRKEFSNKEYMDGLLDGSSMTCGYSKTDVSAFPENINAELKISDMAKFLENPFIWQFTHLLSKEEDSEARTRNEYEPIDLNNLAKREVLKDMIQTGSISSDLRGTVTMKKEVPGGSLETIYLDRLQEMAEEQIQFMNDKGFSPGVAAPLTLHVTDADGNSIGWNLVCNVDFSCNENGDTLSFIEPVLPSKVELKHYFRGYLIALMNLAARRDNNDYKVDLYCVKDSNHFSAKPEEAREILNKLFCLMTDYANVRFIDYSFYTCEEKNYPKNLPELVKKIEHNNSWNYFDDRTMIDPYLQFGYGKNDFQKEFSETLNTMKSCILF